MVNDRPTVYNTSSVYKEAGGGGVAPVPGLPSNYEAVNSIRLNNISQGSNIFRVDNLTLNTDSTHFECVIQRIGTNNVFRYIFSIGALDFRYRNSDGKIFVDNQSSSGVNVPNDDFKKIDFCLSGGNWKVNGNNSGLYGTGANITEFAIGSYGADLYIKSFKAYKTENGALITYADLISVKNENNAYGMYDLIQNRFFTNSSCSQGI